MEKSDIVNVIESIASKSYDDGFSDCAYWVVNNIQLTKEQFEMLDDYMDKEIGKRFNRD